MIQLDLGPNRDSSCSLPFFDGGDSVDRELANATRSRARWGLGIDDGGMEGYRYRKDILGDLEEVKNAGQ